MDNLGFASKCMIKIFWGAWVVTAWNPTLPPTNNFCLYPPPVLRCFWKDSLMTPITPLQASFTATPSPSTTPPAPLKILIIQWYTKGTDHFLHFKIVSFREVFSTFPEKTRGKNIVNNWRQNPVLVGLIQVWMNKISNTVYTISVRD